MGYHDERIVQYRRHINMDDVTYEQIVNEIFQMIFLSKPEISLSEASYLCSALEAEVCKMLEHEKEQAKNTLLSKAFTESGM